MSEKRLQVVHEGAMRFVAQTSEGRELAMDTGDGGTAARPTELVLADLAGAPAWTSRR